MAANRTDGGPGGIVGFLRFLPGGALRLFGPLLLVLLVRPLALQVMPEPRYGWLVFAVFCGALYWTIQHKHKFA